jgi:HlyD family secretion protein
MSIRPLRDEPVMLRDTAAQDRPIERPSLRRRHGKLVVAVLAGVVGLCVLVGVWLRYSGAGGSVDRSRLTIATVERSSFVRDIVADGQVIAAVSPTLYADSLGTVSLKVHAGDSVSRGQVVAVIDSPDLTARLAQEEASAVGLRIDWQRATLDADRTLSQLKDAFEQAQVDQRTAQRELDRSRKAYELGSYTELQALKAQDALEKAQFSYTQARLNYESQPKLNRFDVDSKKALYDRQELLVGDLHRQVERLNVRSPVEGQVGRVDVADRASVAKDAPLLSVIDLSALEIEIKVIESFARDLRAGMTADLDGGGGHFKAVVSGVSPEVIAGQVTARLRFVGDKPSGLRQSQRMSVRIFIDRRENVLMVDRGTFIDQDGGAFVYLVHGNLAERRPVRLGAASIAKVEILEGLGVGDQVVVSGTDAFNGAERVILSR